MKRIEIVQAPASSHRDNDLGREKRHLGGYRGGHGVSGPLDKIKSLANWIIRPLDETAPDQQKLEQAGEAGVRATGLAGTTSWSKAMRDRALAAITANIHKALPDENASELASRWLSEYISREGITFDRGG